MGRRLHSADRREQLIEAAHEVFLAKGVGRARIRDIAESAGVSEAMVYRHFRSKADLFEAAALLPLQRFTEEMATSARDMPRAARRTRHEMSLRLHEHLLDTMRATAPLLSSALHNDAATGEKFFAKRLGPLVTELQAGVQRAMEGWAYHGGDPELVTVMTLGTYHWLALQTEFTQTPAASNDIAYRFLNLIMRALELQTPPEAVRIDIPRATHDSAAVLDERMWQIVEPLLPRRTVPKRGGRWRDHREILRALEWRARTGGPWREIPERYGPWQTAWKRWERWRADGTWTSVLRAVDRAPAPVRQHCAWMYDLAAGTDPKRTVEPNTPKGDRHAARSGHPRVTARPQRRSER